MNHLLSRAEKKMGKYAVKNLMLYIVGTMLLVYVTDILLYASNVGFSLSEALMFNRQAVFSGEVWRLVTFVFIPPDTSIFFILLSLYFSYMIGTSLEAQWGVFKFNVYYLWGMLCTVIAGMITGYATGSYIHLTLFFAFAVIYPDYKVMLFFVIPVKVKYLAMVSGALCVASLILSPLYDKIALIAAMGNFLLFFTGDMIRNVRAYIRRKKYKKEMNDYWKH